MPLLAGLLLATSLTGDPLPPVKEAPSFVARTFSPPEEHAFWDAPNIALFTGVLGARLFDYISTRRFREKHLKEWLIDNGTVDNRPLFLGIEIGGAAASVGFSYLMHRKGFHRAERWASILHIVCGVAGGIWNYTLPNRW